MSGWRVECPGCGEAYLLPEPLARSGVQVRCPGCHARFGAADPSSVVPCARLIEEWTRAQGGIDIVRAAREEGRFWGTFGNALFALSDVHGDRFAPETWQAALARVLGPGRPLF